MRNVPKSCTEEKLKTVFGSHGPIKAARIVTFKDGKPKGLAYVEFNSDSDAAKAKDALNGTTALGDNSILTVDISNPPPKRTDAQMAKASNAARKGAIGAFYTNLGVGAKNTGFVPFCFQN